MDESTARPLTDSDVDAYFAARERVAAHLEHIHRLARKHGCATLAWARLDGFRILPGAQGATIEARYRESDQGDWNSGHVQDQLESLAIPGEVLVGGDEMAESLFALQKRQREEAAAAETRRREEMRRKELLEEYRPLHAEFGSDPALADTEAWWKAYIGRPSRRSWIARQDGGEDSGHA